MDLVWHRLNKAIVPVVTLDQPSQIMPVGERAVELGLTTLEITLRTPVGLPAIAQLKASHPQLILGAGTLLTPQQAQDAIATGAEYLVSPGWSDELYTSIAIDRDPTQIWMPGVTTPSDVMRAQARGFSYLKFFPANVSGGLAMLKSFAQVFSGVYFCPTGGVSLDQIDAYLELENTFAVGGSWLDQKTPAFAEYIRTAGAS